MVMRRLPVAAAGLAFVGAIAATGFAAGAHASPCDPLGIAMTPQPVLSCPSTGAPPVAGDGPPPLSQLGYLREIWHEFHNGVPTDLLYGPAPTDAPPPDAPVPPPPPLIP